MGYQHGNSGSALKQNTNIKYIPEKRKKRAKFMSKLICLITATLTMVFYLVNRNVDVYYRDATQKNTTNVCYKKDKKLSFPGLLTTALSLFGIVLGTLVDRVSLIAEEYFHIKQRYNGSRKKMVEACFSGISWGPVTVLLGLATITVVMITSITSNLWFELSYFVYIFSGVGVGPLIMRLLNVNTRSEVDISTIFEEKQANVANGLAWSYYFNYLEKALPKFNEMVPRNGCNAVQLEQQGRVELNSSKLILLITHDCKTTDDLGELDNNIKELGTFTNGPYVFPVYELTHSDGCKYRYVIKYVEEPLEALVKMSQYARIKLLNGKQLDYQVKLLYKALFEILQDPFNRKCHDKCILVGIHAKSRQFLNNGNLVSIIKQQVKADESALEHEEELFQHFKPTIFKTVV